jgi:hypothetical protein
MHHNIGKRLFKDGHKRSARRVCEMLRVINQTTTARFRGDTIDQQKLSHVVARTICATNACSQGAIVAKVANNGFHLVTNPGFSIIAIPTFLRELITPRSSWLSGDCTKFLTESVKSRTLMTRCMTQMTDPHSCNQLISHWINVTAKTDDIDQSGSITRNAGIIEVDLSCYLIRIRWANTA